MSDRNEGGDWRAFFQPGLMPAEAMQRNAHAFWSAQAEILNNMKALTDGWYQRRHIGAQAAEECCERMCQAKTPLDWVREYQMWSLGAFQRLMADGLALQQGIKKLSDEVGPSIIPAHEQETGAAARVATKSRKPAEA